MKVIVLRADDFSITGWGLEDARHEKELSTLSGGRGT
jgi:hypothetical protein